MTAQHDVAFVARQVMLSIFNFKGMHDLQAGGKRNGSYG